MDRHPMRPAHIHVSCHTLRINLQHAYRVSSQFMVSAPKHKTLVTQVFDRVRV